MEYLRSRVFGRNRSRRLPASRVDKVPVLDKDSSMPPNVTEMENRASAVVLQDDQSVIPMQMSAIEQPPEDPVSVPATVDPGNEVAESHAFLVPSVEQGILDEQTPESIAQLVAVQPLLEGEATVVVPELQQTVEYEPYTYVDQPGDLQQQIKEITTQERIADDSNPDRNASTDADTVIPFKDKLPEQRFAALAPFAVNRFKASAAFESGGYRTDSRPVLDAFPNEHFDLDDPLDRDVDGTICAAALGKQFYKPEYGDEPPAVAPPLFTSAVIPLPRVKASNLRYPFYADPLVDTDPEPDLFSDVSSYKMPDPEEFCQRLKRRPAPVELRELEVGFVTDERIPRPVVSVDTMPAIITPSVMVESKPVPKSRGGIYEEVPIRPSSRLPDVPDVVSGLEKDPLDEPGPKRIRTLDEETGRSGKVCVVRVADSNDRFGMVYARRARHGENLRVNKEDFNDPDRRKIVTVGRTLR